MEITRQTKNKSFSCLDIKDDLYKAVIQNALEGFIILDLKGNILDVNEAFSRMHGYSREELLSMKVYDFSPTKITLNDYTELIKDHIKMGGARFETRHRCKDGRVIDVLVSSKYLDVAGGIFFSFHSDITEQKKKQKRERRNLNRTRENLKESEGRYRTLIELGTNIGRAVIILQDINGKEGVHTYVSDQWPQITGYSKEELLNMSFFDLVRPKDKGVSIQRHRQNMAGQTIPYLFELSIVRKDEEEIPIGITCAVTNYNGKLANVLCARNVTGKKRVEQALRESEILYRIIFETTSSASSLINEDGIIVMVNKAWSNLLEYPKEENLGKHFKEFIAPESLKTVTNNFISRFTKPDSTPSCYEAKFISKSGKKRDVLVSVAMIPGTKNRITSAMDITELKQAEEKRRAIIKTAVDGFLLTDLKGKLIEVNDSYCNMVGYTRKELLEMWSWNIDTIENHKDDIIQHIKQVKKQGQDRFESRHRCKDGKVIDVEVSSNCLGIGHGQIFAFIHDITEYKKTVQELKKYQNQLEKIVEERTTSLRQEIEQRIEFTKLLVHELKTPLTPLLGASETLLNQPLGQLCLGLSKNIYVGAKQLNRRIDELLDLARGEMGTLKISQKQLDARKIIHEICDEMALEIKNKGQNFALNLSKCIPPIFADEDRLEQIILNLLNNAIKFTPEGGTVTLRAMEKDGSLFIEVSDTGCGIGEQEQERLFQPYYKIEGDRERYSGLGLGLSLSKTLVELHHGKIWVNSKKGEGSTFGFSIPLA